MAGSQSSYVEAAILWCVSQNSDSPVTNTQSAKQMRSSIAQEFGAHIDPNIIALALEELVEKRLATRIIDDFTDTYFEFDENKVIDILTDIRFSGEIETSGYDVFRKAAKLGHNWLSEALSRISKLDSDVQGADEETIAKAESTRDKEKRGSSWGSSWGGAPASDRVVPLNHNEPEYEEAVKSVDELQELVRGNNEFAAANPSEHSQIVSELSAIRELLGATQINPSRFEAFAGGTFVYLIEKFADGPISAAADIAWKLLLQLLGLG